MAGTHPRFDRERFVDAIEFVQGMAAAPELDEQAHFYKPSELVYITPDSPTDSEVDADGIPFDPQTTVQRIIPPAIVVPCSITYFDARGEITNFGVITPSFVTVDVLDEHYEKIKGSAFVVIHGDKYVYRRTEPPSGLFDVGIYTLYFDSENES